ncbi:acetate--CoA ligase family protein [Microbacterium sp. zg-Y818]|uniref:acetate--CoA ligase family protein n=1 Tax=unclassified Microbacterium TaxID=2609290 RepID=UPI00214BAD12|nr:MULTISPECIES: acetate--CoA ligase family protein [unclassified Microbacterium]MCR2799331.1 acetate--CoA ligase family protein [Microbacterium sp. zg.Y818]WIM21332.1 acetate--CoA ligase family protein [Microbacterium sp. zg-Y818]
MSADAMAVSVSDLTRLLSPRSIAVVGASDKPGRIGTQLLDNIVRLFAGEIYPVNPRADLLAGLPVVADVDALPDGVDMAIVAVPAEQAVAAVARLATKGVGGVTLLSSGFSESGPEGIARQAELARIVQETGIRVLGPNCIGYMNLHEGVMANFAMSGAVALPEPGPVALVSQSGGFASYLTNASLRAGIRLGYFVSTGNEAGVVLAHAVEHLVEREEVGTVLVFSESLKEPETLIRAARRAHELDKPIALLKAGRTEAAARAAMSHTASVTGSADVLDAVCRQYGIHIAHSMEELIDLGLAFQDGRRARRGAVSIVTASGGAGVLLTDAAASSGLEVPPPPAEAVERITAVMPQPFYGSIENPVDITAQGTASPQSFGLVLDAVRDLDTYDSMAVVTWQGEFASNDRIVETYLSTDKPYFVLSTGYMDKFQAAGVPIYLDPHRLMRSLAAVARQSQRTPLEDAGVQGAAPTDLPRLLMPAAGRPTMLEHDAKALLAAYGVTVTRERLAIDGTDAAAFAGEISGPIALKAMSYDLPHKTEYGAIRLGVRAADAVQATDDMLAEVARKAPHAEVVGVLAQEMVPARLELTVGMRRDPVFGPVVAVGLGGVAVEIMAAAVLLHAPFSHEMARRTIAGLLDGRITSAARGLDEAELDELARTAVAVGRLALDAPEIVEIDVNPVRVHEGRAVAADALIVFDRTGSTS